MEDISQARENADASPWGGRVAFVQCPVQEFAPQGKFDLVVSNPPFFVDSLTCPDAGRTTARHAVRLPFGDLRDAVVRLLSDEGRFAVVLPADEAARFIGICRDVLLPVRRTDVRTSVRRTATQPNGCCSNSSIRLPPRLPIAPSWLSARVCTSSIPPNTVP